MKELFGKYIARINAYLQIVVNHHLEEYGIGSGQYMFLINIYENQGISQKELSSLIKIDKATTAKALKKLEVQGYINRVTSAEDKRYNKLYLSEKAIAFMPKLNEVLAKTSSDFTSGVSDEEYDQAMKVLKMMFSNGHEIVENIREER